MSIKKDILLRVRIAFLLVLIFAGAILYRVINIQFSEGSQWKEMAENVLLKYRKVKATRGNIYSDNESLLATSLPYYKLVIDPTQPEKELLNEELDELCKKLSAHFADHSASFYKKKILTARSEGKKYLILNTQEVSFSEKKKISTWPLFVHGRMKSGVIFEKIEKRVMPFTNLGYRTIGSVNEEDKGVVGLEYSFNDYLSGKDGEALFQKIAGGTWKPIYDGNDIKPQDGLDIVTTIDVNLQDVTETALLQTLQANDADYGCAILMEVATGKIKAMSNLSKDEYGNYRERYNYAVGSQGTTEPGSTFKLVSMLALLESTDTDIYDSIDTGNGETKFFNETMRDHQEGGLGKITIKDAFVKSSNVGISRLIYDKFYKDPKDYISYVEKLHLTKSLGFQITGDGKPYIKHPQDSSWSGITLPWMSVGYELTLTPLHTLTLYNAIANQGEMVKPYIVEKVIKADKVIEQFDKEILNRKICSERTLADLKVMLEGVVDYGTAKNIKNEYYKIAGKTGTAKKIQNGKYTNQYYASFAGYFPADKPKYSCMVVIDNPKGYKIYGSDVAAPVFKQIADVIYAKDIEVHQSFDHEQVMVTEVFPLIKSGYLPELKYFCNEVGISNHKMSDFPWVKTKIVNHSISWTPNQSSKGLIPDVVGMTLKDALYLLENAGLNVQFEGHGRVTSQYPTSGNRVIIGNTIKLTLSS